MTVAIERFPGERHAHAASRCSDGLNASGTLDRCLEAAEPPADRLLRRTHSGRRPTLGRREPTVDLNELEPGPNRVCNPRIGHVGDKSRPPRRILRVGYLGPPKATRTNDLLRGRRLSARRIRCSAAIR